jgi:hypothetical protein
MPRALRRREILCCAISSLPLMGRADDALGGVGVGGGVSPHPAREGARPPPHQGEG